MQLCALKNVELIYVAVYFPPSDSFIRNSLCVSQLRKKDEQLVSRSLICICVCYRLILYSLRSAFVN